MSDCAVMELMTLSRQALDSSSKDASLAVFGVIALDDADTPPSDSVRRAGDLCVDLGALAEDGDVWF